MDDYTLVNIRELDDQAPAHGLSPQVEARSARVPLGLTTSGLGHYRYAPGVRSLGHRHEEQEEVYVVLGGGGTAKLGDALVELRPWDALRVSPATPRAFEAGPDGLELLVFGAPSTENRDVETVADWFFGASREPAHHGPRRSR